MPPQANGAVHYRRKRRRPQATSRGWPGRSPVKPPREKVEEDNQGIAQPLSLGERIAVVFDADRHFDITQAARGDLAKNLRCMRHAVLPKPDHAGAATRHSA